MPQMNVIDEQNLPTYHIVSAKRLNNIYLDLDSNNEKKAKQKIIHFLIYVATLNNNIVLDLKDKVSPQTIKINNNQIKISDLNNFSSNILLQILTQEMKKAKLSPVQELEAEDKFYSAFKSYVKKTKM